MACCIIYPGSVIFLAGPILLKHEFKTSCNYYREVKYYTGKEKNFAGIAFNTCF